MRFSVRLHDAADADTVLRRLLPVLAGARGEQRVAFARYDAERELLVHRWSTGSTPDVTEADIEMEPGRIHSLLADDAGGDRPLRPVDAAPGWVLRDLLPELKPDQSWVRARAVAHEGRWLGVLIVAAPRRWWLPRRSDESVQAAGDVLELCLGRWWDAQERKPEASGGGLPQALAAASAERMRISVREAEARAELVESHQRLDALEGAAGRATELLMEAHVELDRRSTRLRRQTRLLYLLRQLLESGSDRRPASELALKIVQTVAEAFEGHRCSILLVDPATATAELRLGAAVGFPEAVDMDEIRIPLGEGISGEVARSSTAMVVREADDASGLQMVGDDLYSGDAFVSLPLSSQGKLLGVLNLTNFREGTIDNSELEQLRLVALCVGMLADNARLGERLFSQKSA